MTDQEKIRKDLKKYLKENGVKAIFIADKIELSSAMISYFLNGKKDLSLTHLKNISKIIYKYPI